MTIFWRCICLKYFVKSGMKYKMYFKRCSHHCWSSIWTCQMSCNICDKIQWNIVNTLLLPNVNTIMLNLKESFWQRYSLVAFNDRGNWCPCCNSYVLIQDWWCYPMGLSFDLLLSCDSELDHTMDTSHSYRHIPSSSSLQFFLFTQVASHKQQWANLSTMFWYITLFCCYLF